MSSAVPPEILSIAGPLPRAQALRVVRSLGHLQGLSVARGDTLEQTAELVARRAELEAGGPDAEPWRAFAELFAERHTESVWDSR